VSIYAKLIKVQNELKAPKNQYNSFGKYSYRNCEDICESVKPLLLANGLAMFISDNIELIGDRYYIKAIVTVVDTETGETLTNSALAREEENKKGMDSSQVTGSTSSYARKYALNGMFLIDDTKDSDFTNTHGKENNEEKPSRIKGTGLSEAQIKRLYAIAAKANIEKSMVLKAIKQEFKVEKAELLTKEQYAELCARLEKKIK
jgi:hypothetical protein